MHIVEAAAPAAIPTLAPGRRLVRNMDGESNGVLWAVFEDLDLFTFGFTTSVGFDSGATFANATRAGKEAVAWCAAYVASELLAVALQDHGRARVAEPVFAPAPVLEVVGAADFDAAVYGEPEPAVEWDHDTGPLNAVDEPAAPPARNPIGEHMIDGWRIVVGDDRGGAYQAQTFRPDGSAGAVFTGYESAGVALSDAAVWCSGHAVDDPSTYAEIAAEFPVDDPSTYAEIAAEFPVVDDIDVVALPDADDLGATEPDAEAAGWRIFSAKKRNGKFEPVLINATTGEEVDPDDAPGLRSSFDSPEDAIEAGTAWAIENPTQAAIEQAGMIWSHVDAARRPALDADMSRAADRLDRDTAELEAENARLARENATLRQRLADIDTAQVQAAEAATRNAAAREHLNAERARLVELGKANKLAIKGIDAQLSALSADGLELVEKMGSRQLVLIPGAQVSAPRSKAAIAEATLRSTWTHGGIDYALEARENADGWRSWVHGYEDQTEGVGPEREDAERETMDRAVAVLPNAGGLRPPPRVEAPAAEKPRRGRKPKAGAK